MKKKIAAGCLFASIFLLNVQAEAISLSLEPASVSINVSGNFDVDVVLSEMSDLDTISAFDLDIDFDPAVLSFDSYALGDGLGLISSGEAMDSSWGEYVVGGGLVNVSLVSFIWPDNWTGDTFFADQFTSASDSLTLATLSFTAIAQGSSELSFTRDDLGDEWAVRFSPTLTTATVTATAPVPEPATVLLFSTGIAGLLGFRLRRKK